MRLFLDRGRSLTGWTEEGFVPVTETTKRLICQAIVWRSRLSTICRMERLRIPSRNSAGCSTPRQTACQFTFGCTPCHMFRAAND